MKKREIKNGNDRQLGKTLVMTNDKRELEDNIILSGITYRLISWKKKKSMISIMKLGM